MAGPGQSRQAIRRPTCEIRGTQSVTSSGPFRSKVSGREAPGRRSARTRATASGVQRTGSQAVDRLGRQPDHAALCQASDGTMDHVAQVVGLRDVDPLRRNRLRQSSDSVDCKVLREH